MQKLTQRVSQEAAGKVSVTAMVNGNSGHQPIALQAGNIGHVQNIRAPKEKPPQRRYKSRKVSHKRLSRLMRAVLSYIDIDKGVERGEIVECIFGLQRRYCGYFTDPCMSLNEKRKYEHRYRRAQPVLTRCLRKLENRGLVRLIRHGRYVKRISLTPQGIMLTQQKTETHKKHNLN